MKCPKCESENTERIGYALQERLYSEVRKKDDEKLADVFRLFECKDCQARFMTEFEKEESK